MKAWRLGWLSASLLFAAHCENLDPQAAAPKGGAGDPGITTGGSVGGPGLMDDDGVVDLPPEQELEDDFRVPVSTGRFLWTANPESNRVALIDALSFSVRTLDAGFAPTYLAALPTTEAELSGAIVLNTLSNDATVFVARSTNEVEVSEPIDVHPGANAWKISDSGRWAIAWTNGALVPNADVTEGFQDVTVIDLEGYPADAPRVTRLSVGYRPTALVISEAEDRAFAITEPGVSVIELETGDAPQVLRDVVVSEEPAGEVVIAPSGDLAVVRKINAQSVDVVDLDTGETVQVRLPGVVTDLDLSRDASFAVAVVRGTVATDGGELGVAGQAGQPGLAGAGGQAGQSPGSDDTGSGGAPSDPSGETGFTDSYVAILPVPGVFADPTQVATLRVPELFGSVVVPPAGDSVLLFTNAIPSDRVTILNTRDEAWRSVELKAPVKALFSSDDGRHAVGLLAPPPGSTKAGAFSLLPISHDLPPKLQGTEAPTFGVAVSNTNAVITTRDTTKGIHSAYLAGFPGLGVDPVELPSAPTGSGMVLDAGVAFIAQEHAEGRITFVDLEDASARTLTGFELGVKVIDGD